MGHHLGKDEELITKLKSMREGETLEITSDQAWVLAERLMYLLYPYCLVGDELVENGKCTLIGREVLVVEHRSHRYMQFPDVCQECSDQEAERNDPRR